MSVNEIDSGIYDLHARAIEQFCGEKNTFIFVRKTEYDSTRLIKTGRYATKSMDIHDKSSNWGPMAGFVPCDKAFSKNKDGMPDVRRTYHQHLQAYPTQLFLADSLKRELVDTSGRMQKDVQKASSTTSIALPAPGHNCELWRESARTPQNATSKVFCLERRGADWYVWWLDKELHGAALNAYPLMVWAYRVQGRLMPVTGDYDLWMVAPHISHLAGHVSARVFKDPHGSSAATEFITDTLHDLNVRCQREHNPVFNHGAEAQNYGFTQALDQRLAMFTPRGTSEMAQMDDVPQILADLQNAGYLVYWNRKYGEIDPNLGATKKSKDLLRILAVKRRLVHALKARDEARLSLEMAEETYDWLIPQEDIDMDQIDDLYDEINRLRSVRARANWEVGFRAVQLATGKKDAVEEGKRLETAGAKFRILKFHQALQESLSSQFMAPQRLIPSEHFPDAYQQASHAARDAQLQLQRVVVDAQKGEGESGAALLAWFRENTERLEALKDYWGLPGPARKVKLHVDLALPRTETGH